MLPVLFGKNRPSLSYQVIRPPVVSREKTVIVLGCARGGTSMVAGLVRKLDIFMGENIDGPNHEDQDFMTNDILQLKEAIARRDEKHSYWGWKNTDEGIERIRQLLPMLRNPHVIVVFRNFFSVAASFNRYENIDFAGGMEDIGKRYRDITAFMAELTCPVLAVNYDTAIHSKIQTVQGIADFLGLRYSRNLLRKAANFIDSKGGYAFIVEPIALAGITSGVMAPSIAPLPLAICVNNMQPEGQGYTGLDNDPQFILTRADKRPFGTKIWLKFTASLRDAGAVPVLYYSACNIFIEQNAVHLPVSEGENIVELAFSNELKTLRIDPVDNNAYFELSNITVYALA